MYFSSFSVYNLSLVFYSLVHHQLYVIGLNIPYSTRSCFKLCTGIHIRCIYVFRNTYKIYFSFYYSFSPNFNLVSCIGHEKGFLDPDNIFFRLPNSRIIVFSFRELYNIYYEVYTLDGSESHGLIRIQSMVS